MDESYDTRTESPKRAENAVGCLFVVAAIILIWQLGRVGLGLACFGGAVIVYIQTSYVRFLQRRTLAVFGATEEDKRQGIVGRAFVSTQNIGLGLLRWLVGLLIGCPLLAIVAYGVVHTAYQIYVEDPEISYYTFGEWVKGTVIIVIMGAIGVGLFEFGAGSDGKKGESSVSSDEATPEEEETS
jgi:hypothetical protein